MPERRWLDQLIDPGSSLGGARPKANVVDTDGTLYVAKFPSKKDLENTELLEHFSHRLAACTGINVARTRTIKLGWTQLQLSKAIGCTQQHVSVLLGGKVNMTLETMPESYDNIN